SFPGYPPSASTSVSPPISDAPFKPAARAHLELRLAAQRQRECVVQRLHRAVTLAELIQQRRQELVRLQARTNRNARLEITAGLAIEFGARCELSAGEQQRRILRAARQPAFGALQRAKRLIGLQLAKREDGRFVPLPIDALAKYIRGLAVLAARHRRARVGDRKGGALG